MSESCRSIDERSGMDSLAELALLPVEPPSPNVSFALTPVICAAGPFSSA